MSTGGLTRAQHPWLEDERLPYREKTPQDQDSQLERRKIRKKSIRNAKDSAEMARIKYQRKWGQDAAQPPQSMASKLGRHFRVGNGNGNGNPSSGHNPRNDADSQASDRAHRPTSRPSQSAYQSSPPTPPQTSATHTSPVFYWHDGLHESAAALKHIPSTSGFLERRGSFDSANLIPGRTSSDIHLPAYASGTSQSDGQTMRRLRSPSFDSTHPIIQRRRNTSPERPKTAGGLDESFLEVPIPNYRLGTPQFSERGTAFLHNSLHTAFSSTVDLSLPMPNDSARLLQSSTGQRHAHFSPMRRSPISWFSPTTTPAPEDSRPSPMPTPSGEKEITPAVYDRFARDPDNPLWIKYAPEGNDMIAATTARLVMEITSVRFLDYELLSDFFLTYRSFMTSADLARYLFARLGWAVSQSDSTGRIVRVRTFVALRHWVLNYFTDDFEPDYNLRVLFCDLVNKLFRDLQNRPGGGGGDLQVLNELKKCWKRTCALVWESDEGLNHPQACAASDAVSSDSGIGIPDMTATHAHAGTMSAAAQERDILNPGGQSQSYFTHVTPPGTTRRVQVPESPFSDTSIHVTSCSIPMRKRSRPNFKSEKPMKEKNRPQPLQPPRQLQRRPSSRHQTHQRSSSFSDALRDDRAPVSPTQTESANVPESSDLVLRGGLIRGTLIPPNTANIVIPGPLSPVYIPAHGRYRNSDADSLLHPDAISNPAVLKLLGGVRRALSTRHAPKPSLTGGHKPSSSGDLRKMREMQALARPRTVLEPSAKREPPRSDALAALVARSWEEQPRNDAPDDEPPQTDTSMQSQVIPAKDRPLGPTRFNSHVSTGDRSILIVDDTGTTGSSSPQQLSSATFADLNVSGNDNGVMTAEIRDMATNNTAFFLSDPYLSMASDYHQCSSNDPRCATSSATCALSAPLSPPPNMPLPPLPFQSKAAVDVMLPSSPSLPQQRNSQAETAPSEIGVAIGTPSNQDPTSPKHSSKVSSPVDVVKSVEASAPRLLRRRPGGNLKAVDTIQDLGFMHRRQSTGSISSPCYSSPASPINPAESASGQLFTSWSLASKLKDRATDGQIGNSIRRSSLRLLSTHSSQPNLRPSFEAEFRKLASLPGNEDEGDIEATLLKLEGRYQPSRHSDYTEYITSNDDFPSLRRESTGAEDPGDPNETSRLDLDGDSLAPEIQGASIYSHSQDSHETVLHLPNEQPTGSLSPEVDKEVKRWRRSSRVLWSPEPQPHSPTNQPTHFRNKSNIETRDFAKPVSNANAGVIHHARGASEAASSSHTKSSFLLDDNESLLERASFEEAERAEIDNHEEEADQSFLLDEEEEEAGAESGGENFHPPQNQHPPTPPTTAGASSETASLGASSSLLTPGPAPEAELKAFISVGERSQEVYDSEKQLNFTPREQRKGPPSRLHMPRQIPTHHTPFILAYSSSALAAQFTLIEKDALDCIDWKDLVNLSWSQDSYTIRDWAQYTHSLDAPASKISSVDLIIARFNLVIKWCISSVLLCATAADRATCITKFIHVANHAHIKLRNFATTAQITIGLLSSDLARLTKTWELVATADKNILKKLEILVSPVRNFAALRLEMESAAAMLDEGAVGADKGVIPFVGVYTRDLALNAQKPAFFAPDNGLGRKDQEQLINFERHRTAATIVKGVLRLLDASSRYTIKPQQEVLSRCLWLAALADGELASLSKGLE